MIDNIDLIKPLLTFDSTDDFYYLQIIQRKKDMKDATFKLGTNNSARSIKEYYISNIEYLEKKYHEIKTLCDVFNARASIRLNRRSYKKVAFKTLANIANTMSNGEMKHIKSCYSKACGQTSNEKTNKTWIIDIDDMSQVTTIKTILLNQELRPEGTKLVAEIPSKSGLHLITRPFDIKKAQELGLPKADIHKNNPTNLYIP